MVPVWIKWPGNQSLAIYVDIDLQSKTMVFWGIGVTGYIKYS